MVDRALTWSTITSVYVNCLTRAEIVKRNWTHVHRIAAGMEHAVRPVLTTWTLHVPVVLVTQDDCASKMWMNAWFQRPVEMEQLVGILTDRIIVYAREGTKARTVLSTQMIVHHVSIEFSGI